MNRSRAATTACHRDTPDLLVLELFSRVVRDDGVEQLIEVAVEHTKQLVRREVDPVVRDAALR
jgi:hypothetical protein